MSRQLISLNPDLQKLRDDGYDVAIDPEGAYLLVRDVPYVTHSREVKRGVLISKLDLAGDRTIRPSNHQAQFIGEHPCHADARLMTELVISSGSVKLTPNLVTDHDFSQKPACGYYQDYYEKMSTYAAILLKPAQLVQPGVTPLTFVVEEGEEADTPFVYRDTASSRAEIDAISAKMKLSKIAIIGGGGTGSYVVDLTSKTPVREIHIFDGDKFASHNAFRAPGAASIQELREQPYKVDYLAARYANMHRGIVPHPVHVTESNCNELQAMQFVFICIDDGPAKRVIVSKLIEWKIPFIDVGMGLSVRNGALGGIVRVTSCTPDKHDHILGRISMGQGGNNEYEKNIQVADLNALNAALAVIKWKKLFGFYDDQENEHQTTYTIDCNLLTSDDCP